MNLQNIFNEIEKTDPEVYERLDSRRNVMHRFTNLGGKLALTALPFALGSMLNKAYGQTSTDIVGILNFALTLEYLEAAFYEKALGTADLIKDQDDVAAFTLIKQHEDDHVAFLTTTISSLQGTPATEPEFDFTAQGIFPTVFSNYATFLALSQTFEDTGVRAYKGQAGNLIANNTVLTAALQIHSIEARHAAHVRRLRAINDPSVKPWITGKSTSGIGSSVQSSYDGEENVTQLGIDVTNLPGVTGASATEAFDEPLTMEQVLAIVDPFIV